jgi:hypothetical protein
MLMIVVHSILVFHFGESYFRFLESLHHLIHELIDRLKFQWCLMRFKDRRGWDRVEEVR